MIKSMTPQKLKKGDEIRVISPAKSLMIISPTNREIAIKNLESLGLKVSFGNHTKENDEFGSSSIESRIEDLHEAFGDKNVAGILTTIGGYNSNQLLRYIDYDLIKNNPKIFCGYSDITVLQNAILAKTGLVSYSGPHFSTFGMLKGLEYTIEYFEKCLLREEPYEISASKEWSDDLWYQDQEKREFIENKGPFVINPGEASGTIIGGNLGTFRLLQGTEYMPNWENAILFLEDCNPFKPHDFDRELQSLIHLPSFSKIKEIVLGRFQKSSGLTFGLIKKIIQNKKELTNLPVIADLDFGHTTPQITFPIGGEVEIEAGERVKIEIKKH